VPNWAASAQYVALRRPDIRASPNTRSTDALVCPPACESTTLSTVMVPLFGWSAPKPMHDSVQNSSGYDHCPGPFSVFEKV
jgi:hypothetical protein